MNKKIKDFIRSNKKILIFNSNYGSSMFADLRKVRSYTKVAYNYLLLRFGNIIPSSRIKKIVYTYLVGLNIGENAGISVVYIDPFLPELITIGNNAIIGWQTKILTHEYTQTNVRVGRVSIGNNVLIGAFSTIRSGVTIGDNSTVAMNSLVNKDIPPNELWGGVPARRIKKI